MLTLTKSQREFLDEATLVYEEEFLDSPAAEYIASRGLDPVQAQRMFHLGHVSDPLPSHERFRGMLAIPYLAKSGTVGIKFRRLDDGTPKYLATENSRVRLFNVLDSLTNSSQVLIVEGEMDTITAKLAGVPAVVGVAGANNWKSHFARVLDGFDEVLICVDNDLKNDSVNAGQVLAGKILREIPHARNIIIPSGMDINDVYCVQGHEGLLSTLGVKIEPQH